MVGYSLRRVIICAEVPTHDLSLDASPSSAEVEELTSEPCLVIER